MRKLTVIQTLPALNTGGVERGTLEVAAELVRCGHRSIVVSAGGELLDELISSGSEHFGLPVGHKSLLSLRYIHPFRRLINESRPDIVHARSRLPAWISYLAWKDLDPATRPRFITSVHGPYSVNRYSKIMTKGERVIAISEFIRTYILENYPHTPPDQIRVIPRGVSGDRYPYGYQPSSAWMQAWRRQYPGLQDQRLITLPGRLTRWKGQQDFLQIFSQLPRHPQVHGLIVGGPQPGKQHYFDELKTLARQLGLQDRITFTGHRADLREIMSISSLVMSLSTEPEAFGRTVLEALCLGVPVIAYAHGGAAEVMADMFAGGMIATHDIAAAVALTLKFLGDRPTVPDHNPYTLRRMLDSTLRLYEELANDPEQRLPLTVHA